MLTFALSCLFACGTKSDSGTTEQPDPDSAAETTADDTGGPEGADTDGASACLDIDPPPVGDPALVFTGDRPTNLLIISIDTLNISHLPRYGGQADVSALDALLSEGVTLDNHFACAPWTFPGVLCSMTGRSNIEIGYIPTVFGLEPGSSPAPAPTDVTYLPDLLKSAGYATGLVTANSYLSSPYTIGRGFQLEIAGAQNGWPSEPILSEGRDMVASLRAEGSPWYGHIHLIDAHASYHPPEAYLGDYEELAEGFPFDLYNDPGAEGTMLAVWDTLSEAEQALGLELTRLLYDGELAYMDDQIELFLSDMDAAGALEDTLVVFWSDHGEQFMGHGDIGHGVSLYNGELGALASFWMKDGGLEQVAWTGPTDQRDIVPTIADALGVAPLEEWSGRVAGTADPGRALMGVRRHGEESTQSLIRGGNKMVYWWGAEAPEYYDLATDYDEQIDIYDASDAQHACDYEAIQAQTEAVLALYP